MSQDKQHNGSTSDFAMQNYVVKDPEAFAQNLTKFVAGLGQVAAAWMEPREAGDKTDEPSEIVTDMVRTFSSLTEYWLSDSSRAFEAQTRLMSRYFSIWSNNMQRLSTEYQAEAPGHEVRDRRFQDEDWAKNAMFGFLKDTYLATSDWAQSLVFDAEGLDDQTRHKAQFYTQQVLDAISPSNFFVTNPEVYKETIATNGENLVRGIRMLAEDIEAGKGDVKIRQAGAGEFKLGENIATTPGKVVARSEIAEIIQYEASTKRVNARPILICPPWINKFYILDLNEQKSFVRWCVSKGLTVFVISWVNPDERHRDKDWNNYIREGIQFALDAITDITKAKEVNAIGYCIGGSLLSAAMALFAQEDETRIKSATLFATQVDFVNAGDLKVFVDERQIAALEAEMMAKGYLDGSKMATAFNMLRANDLIWSYAVSNYLKGKEPRPFDLLHWNSDATRMSAANHSYYLRNLYLENNLSQGRMELDGKRLSLSDIKVPIYNLAAKEDHIAPAKSVFVGAGYFGGPMEYVLSGSGHIAGVVNPPEKHKYQYWTGAVHPKQTYEEWLDASTQTPGSWWPHWLKWIKSLQSKTKVAPSVGSKDYPPIEDAPGSYVTVRS